MSLYGAVELGGTKIRVGRGRADGRLTDHATFATEGPDASIARIRAFFDAGPPIAGLGVGSFGPVALRLGPGWGVMGATPKQAWRGFALGDALAAMGVPVRLETDVGAAGLGEAREGALRGAGCGLYLTVGTGIGGALLVDGRIVNGAAHAEMGHIAVARIAGDTMPSVCAHHPSCVEGLASGPAIARRIGRSLSEAGAADVALIGDYLGQLLATLVLTVSPDRIVMGGGVAKAPGLIAAAERRMAAHVNDYLDALPPVVPPALGDDAGLVGALFLGAEADRRN